MTTGVEASTEPVQATDNTTKVNEEAHETPLGDQDVEMESIHPAQEESRVSSHTVTNTYKTSSMNDEPDDDNELSSSGPDSGEDGEDGEDGEGEGEGDDDEEDRDEEEEYSQDERDDTGRNRVSRGHEESNDEDEADEDDEDETLSTRQDSRDHTEVCRWKGCDKVLSTVEDLVIHLSDEHVGWKKDSYTCEWQECDKSFSRSDAMAKHLKCQHGDVPERFTGRKSRGRYTMKNPTASSTLLRRSGTQGMTGSEDESSHQDRPGKGRKRRLGSPSASALLSSHKPSKIRKVEQSSGLRDSRSQRLDSFQRHYRKNHTDLAILRYLNSDRKNKHRSQDGSKQQEQQQEQGEESGQKEKDDDSGDGVDSDTDDIDFAHDNGQTPKVRYQILKEKFRYIYNERELLESEYEEQKRKLLRLKVERELLIDALALSKEEYQDPALEDIEDSE
ncbi:hypothetical protein BGZ94_004417 [Podila epigama]|nr:hypothetical protein BGZ94_004417 [Podila epigama]